MNNCKIVNIVWIERGIILTIINYIIKYYDILLDKNIIINNLRYIKFFKKLFSKLNFSLFKKHAANNFYFNIRNIIKKQDIIIDYLANYDKIINTKKINIIPWYDMNDILIVYKFNSNEKIKLNNIKLFITEFSKCRRGNYNPNKNIINNNNIWDVFIENNILKKYIIFNNTFNIYLLLEFFNKFIKSSYTNTIIEYPKIYYIPINNQAQNQGQSQSQGRLQGQNQSQGRLQGQSQGRLQTQDQGQLQGQNQGRLQTQGQGQLQGQLQGQSQGRLQGQSQGQLQGQNQGRLQTQIQGQTQGQNQLITYINEQSIQLLRPNESIQMTQLGNPIIVKINEKLCEYISYEDQYQIINNILKQNILAKLTIKYTEEEVIEIINLRKNILILLIPQYEKFANLKDQLENLKNELKILNLITI